MRRIDRRDFEPIEFGSEERVNNPMEIWSERIEGTFNSIAEGLINPLFTPITSSMSRRRRLIQWGWVLVFLLTGYLVFVFFLNSGRIPFEIQDWPKEWQYYTILKQALTEGIIPLHFSPATITPDRFLALPETVLSPQIFLLKFLDQGQFVLVNTLFLYSIGFLGCFLIGQRYRMSPFIFGIMVLLFGFNGHIMTHLSVGHSMWLGYYFLPFFFILLFRLSENDQGTNWSIWMALILFGIVLQGSIHIFVWCVFFLILLWLFSNQHRSEIFYALVVAFFLSAFRLFPAGLQYGSSSHAFFPGYLSLTDAIEKIHTTIHPRGCFCTVLLWISLPADPKSPNPIFKFGEGSIPFYDNAHCHADFHGGYFSTRLAYEKTTESQGTNRVRSVSCRSYSGFVAACADVATRKFGARTSLSRVDFGRKYWNRELF
jgi:hypothetical protein